MTAVSKEISIEDSARILIRAPGKGNRGQGSQLAI
jgi:hypothetical protein